MAARAEQAVSKFLEGYNCAQAVFSSFCDDLGIDKDQALRIACGFGGGMGRKQEVCGAVTGGIMVIGAKYGQGETPDPTAKELTYARTRELIDQFSQRHGNFTCIRLLNGCDLQSPDGHKFFYQKELYKTCVACVRSVIEILENMLK